ncbi:hypothetical protein O6H91_22G013500 [Diphasiastrum complanatum]|uniref:Uncharacterized protein n=3 Tax=Diphasiastrum complanatum TaxID=34168 RepID=A0ACC2AD05_DIPCM|nr:hypothetical protein O6H91_22G013500 [Diphasiastrum complanatum]KAJ7515447.1 hypothetical protein O6H91_22G013500 [Diphasiastrum complanatum]KAJ7515448.1 hypothetical protein O6H91_22G013500 [Diphasiastrum complanatum]
MMQWQWESATAGAVAGFATVVTLHPLDIVRTRFQVSDGHTRLPKYKNTPHALYTIARSEGLRGLYAGLFPAILGSSLSWGLYFLFYNNAKVRHQQRVGGELGPGLHLLSAAEAGALVSVFTNPVWLVKTRLQLQPPGHGPHRPYKGFTDALRRIIQDEGWWALYKGLGPGLLLVSHGALQFMAYEESRKIGIAFRLKNSNKDELHEEDPLSSVDYLLLGASSKLFAVFFTYPFQVIRSRVQQRPSTEEATYYKNSWVALKSTLRHEGVRGLYKGIFPNLLRVVPSSSITFLVYEKVKKVLM